MAIKVFKASDYYTADDQTITIEQFMRKIAEVWGTGHSYYNINGHAVVLRTNGYTDDYAWFFSFSTTSSPATVDTFVTPTDTLYNLKGTSLNPVFGVVGMENGQVLGRASYYAGWKGASRISRNSFSNINNLFNAVYTLQYDKMSNVIASAIYPYAVGVNDEPFMLQPNILEVQDAGAGDMKFIKLPQYSDATIVLISKDLSGDTMSESTHTPIHNSAASGTTLQAVQVYDGKHLFPNIYTYNTEDYTILNGVRDMSQIVESDIGVRYPAISIGGEPYGVVMYANGANSCGVLIK